MRASTSTTFLERLSKSLRGSIPEKSLPQVRLEMSQKTRYVLASMINTWTITDKTEIHSLNGPRRRACQVRLSRREVRNHHRRPIRPSPRGLLNNRPLYQLAGEATPHRTPPKGILLRRPVSGGTLGAGKATIAFFLGCAETDPNCKP